MRKESKRSRIWATVIPGQQIFAITSRVQSHKWGGAGVTSWLEQGVTFGGMPTAWGHGQEGRVTFTEPLAIFSSTCRTCVQLPLNHFKFSNMGGGGQWEEEILSNEGKQMRTEKSVVMRLCRGQEDPNALATPPTKRNRFSSSRPSSTSCATLPLRSLKQLVIGCGQHRTQKKNAPPPPSSWP